MAIAGGMMANKSQEKQSAKQMVFQERMSNTAHQREVRDLRAAGLNPILSANKGASSPGGAQANIRNIAEGATSSALAASRNKKELALLDAQFNATSQAGQASSAQASKALAEEALLKQGLPGAKAEADLYSSEYGALMKFAEKMGINASSALSLTKGLGRRR